MVVLRKHVLLVHWNSGECAERAARLRALGYEVTAVAEFTPDRLRAISGNPPAAFVVDLSRRPSHGRDVAQALRMRKATRHVPILFLQGEPEKVGQIRSVLPDAVYSSWQRLRADLKRALSHPPAEPVVPKPMAGYSGTPLPKKLGIKPGITVSLLNAPAGFERTLGSIREDSRCANIVFLFAASRLELERFFPAAVRAMAEKGGLWIIWPKKTSSINSDLDQNSVRRFGLDNALVDYKICAVDSTWSGLLFARRRSRA
jgi:CheY-like chemotaxis protein